MTRPCELYHNFVKLPCMVMNMAIKKGLGKGLEALFIDNSTSVSNSLAEIIKINDVEPNRNQPRKQFDDDAMQQLADSIREHGIIQPIMVRPVSAGGYQIIAGERRWRAGRMAGLTEIPVIIRDYDDNKAMEIALIENLQRENLNPIEEALGYRELIETYSMTQAEVSASVGKSRSAVTNFLRLLNLPDEVLTLVQQGKLSSGHARALLAFEDEEQMKAVAEKCAQTDMTVREVEKLAKIKPVPEEKEAREIPIAVKRDSYFDEIEIALNEELHRKVKVSSKQEKGTIEIAFYSKEDLSEIANRLAGIIN